MFSYSHRFDFGQFEIKDPPAIKRTVCCGQVFFVFFFAHGRRDTFQIVIKDCPKTTHAYSAILGSWHVSIFAQFFVHTDILMESTTLLHFCYF